MPVTIGAKINFNISDEQLEWLEEKRKYDLEMAQGMKENHGIDFDPQDYEQKFPKPSGKPVYSIDYMQLADELYEQSKFKHLDLKYDPKKEQEGCGEPDGEEFPCRVQKWWYDLPEELRAALYRNHTVYLADFLKMAYPYKELLDEFNENTELLFWCDNVDVDKEEYDLFMGLCDGDNIFTTTYMGHFKMNP